MDNQMHTEQDGHQDVSMDTFDKILAGNSDTIQNEMLQRFVSELHVQDTCREDMNRIASELTKLRLALDESKHTDLVDAYIEGVRVPMTAAMVLEAKRVELHRALHRAGAAFNAMVDSSNTLIDASYIDQAAETGRNVIPTIPSAAEPELDADTVSALESDLVFEDTTVKAPVAPEQKPAERNLLQRLMAHNNK